MKLDGGRGVGGWVVLMPGTISRGGLITEGDEEKKKKENKKIHKVRITENKAKGK